MWLHPDSRFTCARGLEALRYGQTTGCISTCTARNVLVSVRLKAIALRLVANQEDRAKNHDGACDDTVGNESTLKSNHLNCTRYEQIENKPGQTIRN